MSRTLRISPAWLLCSVVGILLANSILAQEYTPPSRMLHWGGPGDGPGEFADPVAIAMAPDGTLFVTDSALARVQRFSSSGKFLLQIGPSGTKNLLDHPVTSATDHHGHLFVADPNRIPYHVVHRFEQSGSYGGAIDLRMNGLLGDEGNRIYGSWKNRISVFVIDGSIVRSWEVGEPGVVDLHAMAWLPDGRLIVVDRGTKSLHLMDREGSRIETWSIANTVEDPCGIATDARHVFVADRSQKRIVVFDMDGSLRATFPIDLPDGRRLAPQGLVMTPNHTLYVTAGPYVLGYSWGTSVRKATWSDVRSRYRR